MLSKLYGIGKAFFDAWNYWRVEWFTPLVGKQLQKE